jgi:predicted dehydrogenase
MSMADGSVASIVYTAGGDSSVAKERIEVFCDRSVATIDDFRKGSFVHDRKSTKLGRRTQDKGHAAEVEAFFEAIRGGSGAPIGLESLLATTLASFAVVESARSAVAVAVDVNSMFSLA